MALNNFMSNLYKYCLLALLILLILIVASCNHHSAFYFIFTALLLLLVIVLFDAFYPTTTAESMANISFPNSEESNQEIYIPYGDEDTLPPVAPFDVSINYKKEGTNCPPFDIAYVQSESYIAPNDPSIYEDKFDRLQRGYYLADQPGSAQSPNNLILSPIYTKGYFMENNCEYIDYNAVGEAECANDNDY